MCSQHFFDNEVSPKRAFRPYCMYAFDIHPLTHITKSRNRAGPAVACMPVLSPTTGATEDRSLNTCTDAPAKEARVRNSPNVTKKISSLIKAIFNSYIQ
jgi:hypothetical protein